MKKKSKHTNYCHYQFHHKYYHFEHLSLIQARKCSLKQVIWLENVGSHMSNKAKWNRLHNHVVANCFKITVFSVYLSITGISSRFPAESIAEQQNQSSNKFVRMFLLFVYYCDFIFIFRYIFLWMSVNIWQFCLFFCQFHIT